MKNRIKAIIICIVLFGSTIIQINGIKGYSEGNISEEFDNSYSCNSLNKYAWSGAGHGLDAMGIISVVVPSSFPVYLSFSTRYEIYSPDNGIVELSSDGGNNWYPLDYVTGLQLEWVMQSVDISSFAGLPVLIRFRYTTGSFSTSGGWFVDTISVKDVIVEDFESYNDGDSWGDWIIIEEEGELPPVVSITYPENGDTLSDTVMITGKAHDPNGDTTIEWVMVKIDDNDWNYTEGITSWIFLWDTTTVVDGTHIISAMASDGILQSSVMSITVIVDNGGGPVDKPDLIVTDVWNENDIIWYQVRNIGNDTAMSEHHSALFINAEYKVSNLVNTDLSPGERFTSFFNYEWECTELKVDIGVIADYNEDIDENNEFNNQCDESWKCDIINPRIIDGPRVQDISQRSATIYWKTDENCDSMVRFDRYAGVYDNIVKDSELVKDHYIELIDLIPGTIYHFMVESMDASGNRVKSHDFYFKTKKDFDTIKPSLYPYIPDILSGIVNISIDASDNIGVDRVHFSCDDEPIFTIYSPPYNFDFYTGGLLDGEHDFGFDAIDEAGNTESVSLMGIVRNKFTPDLRPPINVQIMHPEEGEEYVLGDVIHIYVKVESKNNSNLTEYAIKLDNNMPYLHTGEIKFIPCINDIIIDEIDPHARENVSWIHYWWDTRDYTPDGATLIEVFVWDEHDNMGVDSVQFDLTIPPPDIQVFRNVERIGNYYEIELKIRNNGVIPIKNIQISDTNVGFQCDDSYPSQIGRVTVLGGAESFNEGFNSFGIGEYSQIQIDLVSLFDLDQNEEVRVLYHVIPILYDCDPWASVGIEGLEWHPDRGTIQIPHVIGHKLLIEYDYFGESSSLEKDDLRYDLTHNNHHDCEDDVSFAFRDAGYLIVTSPTKLNLQNPGDTENINELLVTMAELARKKNGVLGYTWTNSSSKLKSYINEHGYWWENLCRRIDRRHRDRGPFNYLLLVGEIEIIPAFRGGPFDVGALGLDGVEFIWDTDYPYSNIRDDSLPDIAVGRIIGNVTSDLIQPIRASLDVYYNIKDFDRSNVLLVSGTGEGGSTFRRNLNDIHDIMLDIFMEDFLLYRAVWKIHWRDFPDEEFNEFSAHTRNRDIIFFRGHGSPTSWKYGLTLPLNESLVFGNSRPFVFATSCHTGDYENDFDDGFEDFGIAETFFYFGAAVYIGATDWSLRSNNNAAGKWFFRNWDSLEPAGKTLQDLKFNYYYDDDWVDGDLWKIWCYEYNYYGDPKFGAVPMDGFKGDQLDNSSSLEIDLEESLSSLDVVIPDYIVTPYEGLDYVEIPDGEILCVEQGRPEVPYVKIHINYPNEYKVQNVILKEKSGLTTDTGLVLPLVVFNQTNTSIKMIGDWYPQVDYNWRIEKNDDGNTTLVIAIYPFYYNPNSTRIKFYKNYVFDIEYVSSDATITALYADKHIYTPGDEALINLWIENSGQLKDFITNIVIKEEVSEEIIEGLLIRLLEDLEGLGSYSVKWNIPLNRLGSYYIEAIITDIYGNLLEKATYRFSSMIPSTLKINSISGGLGISAVVENSGSENLTSLKWSILIEGDNIFYGDYTEGIINLIESGKMFTINSGLLFGFGPAKIIINVAGIEKTGSCFLFGPFVLGLS